MGDVLAFLIGLAVVVVPYVVLRPVMRGTVQRAAGRGIALLVGLGLIAGVILMSAFGTAAFLGVGLGLLYLLLMAGRAVSDAATKGKVGDPISPEEARRLLRGAGDEHTLDALLAAERERTAERE